MARTLPHYWTGPAQRTSRIRRLSWRIFACRWFKIDTEKAGSASCGFIATATGMRSASSTSRQWSRAICPRLHRRRQFDVGFDRHHQECGQYRCPRKHRACTEEFLPGADEKISRQLSAGELCRGDGATKPNGAAEFWRQTASGHSFMLDSNGKPFVEVAATREGSTLDLGHRRFYLHESRPSPAGKNTSRIPTPRFPRPPTGCAPPAWWRRGMVAKPASYPAD